MSLRIRALEIDIATAGGPFGASFRFADGLNIIHAANSRGKSTSLTAMTWALGMEGVLSASNRGALQAVVTQALEGPDGSRHRVHSSHALLEIENENGEIITIVRPIAGKNSDLVSVFAGGVLTNASGSYKHTDYFTRIEGAASRERGFLTFLASFCGLRLPQVARYDGTECPLYLQTLYPLHYVEQKRGWSALQALTPVQYQIRDVQKRALEFVLDLQVYALQKQRAELVADRQRVQTRWTATVAAIRNVAARLNGEARALQTALSDQGAKRPAYDVVVKADQRWFNLPQYIEHLKSKIIEIDSAVLPAREQMESKVRQTLTKLENDLAQSRLDVRISLDKLLKTQSEEASVMARLQSLEEDRKRCLDAKRLIDLGSTDEALLNLATCPTCQQGIADSILPKHIVGDVMSVPDNIAFIESQISAFRAILPMSQSARSNAERELQDIRTTTSDLEVSIADVRRTLTDGASPTLGALRERVRIEGRYEAASAGQDELIELYEAAGDLHDEYYDIQAKIKSLPSGELTLRDLQLLKELQSAFRDQLTQYQFSSVPISSIEMSLDNYRPISGHFDLAHQVSASDNIRSIWAYLLSLMELAHGHKLPHHLGVLILDEPRQQEIETASLRALLARAARSKQRGQQVIFASSQEDLDEHVRGLPVNVIGSVASHDRLITPKKAQSKVVEFLNQESARSGSAR